MGHQWLKWPFALLSSEDSIIVIYVYALGVQDEVNGTFPPMSIESKLGEGLRYNIFLYVIKVT